MEGLFLPIRFYEDEFKTTFYKDCEGYNHQEYFRSPNDYILPFQILDSGKGITPPFYLVDCRGDETLLDLMTYTVNVVKDDVPMTYVINPGTAISAVPAGIYQLRVGSDYEDHFSDPFMMSGEILALGEISPKFVKIRYRSHRQQSAFLGDIYFEMGWFAMCYVESILEKPRYPILNESRQDGEMNEKQLFQRWEKRRRVQFKGIESMADALSLLPLMERVQIQDVDVYDPVVNISWDDEYSCLCNIEITFLTAKAIKSF